MTDQPGSQPFPSSGETLAGALNDTARSAMATLPPSLTAASAGYPVQVTFETQPRASRFWAIPLLGYTIKYLILIPHVIALSALGCIVVLLQFIAWVPVLTTGRYPDWAYSLLAGTIRWGVRIQAYAFGLTDQYPPFTLGNRADTYPVQVTIIPHPRYNRAWAVPIAGFLVKLILLIPHIFILYVFGSVVGFLQYVLWIPVLFTGTYPDWGYDMVGGYLRWSVRVTAYLYGLTDAYPPFQMAASPLQDGRTVAGSIAQREAVLAALSACDDQVFEIVRAWAPDLADDASPARQAYADGLALLGAGQDLIENARSEADLRTAEVRLKAAHQRLQTARDLFAIQATEGGTSPTG